MAENTEAAVENVNSKILDFVSTEIKGIQNSTFSAYNNKFKREINEWNKLILDLSGQAKVNLHIKNIGNGYQVTGDDPSDTSYISYLYNQQRQSKNAEQFQDKISNRIVKSTMLIHEFRGYITGEKEKIAVMYNIGNSKANKKYAMLSMDYKNLKKALDDGLLELNRTKSTDTSIGRYGLRFRSGTRLTKNGKGSSAKYEKFIADGNAIKYEPNGPLWKKLNEYNGENGNKLDENDLAEYYTAYLETYNRWRSNVKRVRRKKRGPKMVKVQSGEFLHTDIWEPIKNAIGHATKHNNTPGWKGADYGEYQTKNVTQNSSNAIMNAENAYGILQEISEQLNKLINRKIEESKVEIKSKIAKVFLTKPEFDSLLDKLLNDEFINNKKFAKGSWSKDVEIEFKI